MAREEDAPQLFVQEEEESSSDEVMEETEQFDEDPIIKSIPIILNNLQNDNQGLHILQYPGRVKTRLLDDQSYTASIKPESKYLEVKIPLDQSKFFNLAKGEDWGETIVNQSLQGVLDDTEEGIYVGQLVNNEKIVLLPVDSTGQLRPQFKYVDDIDAAVYAQRRADYIDTNPTNVSILQSAAKPNSQSTESHNALGESLKHVKKFDEENWSGLNWVKSTNVVTKNIKTELQNSADKLTLEPQSTMEEYIDVLTNSIL